MVVSARLSDWCLFLAEDLNFSLCRFIEQKVNYTNYDLGFSFFRAHKMKIRTCYALLLSNNMPLQ